MGHEGKQCKKKQICVGLYAAFYVQHIVIIALSLCQAGSDVV